jgi:hypothetical protein
MLHIVNGDATGEPLSRSGVPGTVAVWADILHEGPVRPDLDAAGWREARAQFLGRVGYLSAADALATYAMWDAALATHSSHDEIVIWLEHDLFDQLLLTRHIEWFSRRTSGRTRLSLICIGEFPGIVPFHGLGQLGPTQLASLLSSRHEMTGAEMALGRRAWAAFTAADPEGLQQLLDEDTTTLPFLEGALRRLLEEYPAVGTGLPRTERHVLEVLTTGDRSGMELFRGVQALEDRVFMGDTTFWARVLGLARGDEPLVVLPTAEMVSELPDLSQTAIAITDTGRAVLAGERDWVELGVIDKWIGGVHLNGRTVPWRWDGAAGRLRSIS